MNRLELDNQYRIQIEPERTPEFKGEEDSFIQDYSWKSH